VFFFDRICVIFTESCVRKVKQTNRHSLLEFDHLNQSVSVQYSVQGWTKIVQLTSRTLQFQALLHTSSRYVAFLQCYIGHVIHCISIILLCVMWVYVIPWESVI